MALFERNADYDDYFYYTHEGAAAVRHDDAGTWKIFTRRGREPISCSEGYYYIQNIRGDVVIPINALIHSKPPRSPDQVPPESNNESSP